MSLELDIIDAGYRALAKKYHPDTGSSASSDARMADLNKARDWLKTVVDQTLRFQGRAVAVVPTDDPMFIAFVDFLQSGPPRPPHGRKRKADLQEWIEEILRRFVQSQGFPSPVKPRR